jgi:hypothetical protein
MSWDGMSLVASLDDIVQVEQFYTPEVGIIASLKVCVWRR